MAQYTVYFGTGATSAVTVDVDIDPDMNRDEARQTIEDAAYARLDAGLCHQCSRHLDLGDWEPDAHIAGFDPEEN